jgi:hypothetical protein
MVGDEVVRAVRIRVEHAALFTVGGRDIEPGLQAGVTRSAGDRIEPQREIERRIDSAAQIELQALRCERPGQAVPGVAPGR